MDGKIIRFIKKQTCAGICCTDEQGKPWCFSCFYAFDSEDVLLYFKSSSDSHHSQLLKIKPFISGTILPDKLNPIFVKGIQFEGVILEATHPLVNKASGYYHKKYPIAIAMNGEVSVIQVCHIKMTDSIKGFGKKISWRRNKQTSISELTRMKD
jgi:uncharacterized protein YhbP (UPF0306 family)